MTQPEIKVGILSSKEIHFEFYGLFISHFVERRLSGRFKAEYLDGKIKISNEEKEVFIGNEVTFFPKDIEIDTFLLKDVVIGINFHWQKKENQKFRGKLNFIIENEKLTAINILPLEEYLTSVISSEMSPNASIELLKAHAIISRGWILAQLAKKKNQTKQINEIINGDEIIRWYDREDHLNYDFCADDHCQRYQGITKIINDNAYNAISETAGLFLAYNDKICDTRFSKCCGGITETFENVWEEVPHNYLQSFYDYKYEDDDFNWDLTKEDICEKWIQTNPHAFCNTSDKKVLSQVLVDFDRDTNDFYRWQVEYNQDEISELIKTKSGIDFGLIKEMLPIQRGKSGRLIKLKIIGTKETKIVGKELEIRKWLSKTHLYSSAFIVKKVNVIDGIPQKFILKGAGWGHGVGLCQIGAAVMGELGYTFDEILKHYFRGASIQKGY